MVWDWDSAWDKGSRLNIKRINAFHHPFLHWLPYRWWMKCAGTLSGRPLRQNWIACRDGFHWEQGVIASYQCASTKTSTFRTRWKQLKERREIVWVKLCVCFCLCDWWTVIGWRRIGSAAVFLEPTCLPVENRTLDWSAVLRPCSRQHVQLWWQRDGHTCNSACLWLSCLCVESWN